MHGTTPDEQRTLNNVVIHMIWGVGVAVSSGKRFTVLCPAAHRSAPYLCRAVSPDHRNSHCSFEMSIQILCVSWCRVEVTMISSIRRLRIRRCLVTVAKVRRYTSVLDRNREGTSRTRRGEGEGRSSRTRDRSPHPGIATVPRSVVQVPMSDGEPTVLEKFLCLYRCC